MSGLSLCEDGLGNCLSGRRESHGTRLRHLGFRDSNLFWISYFEIRVWTQPRRVVDLCHISRKDGCCQAYAHGAARSESDHRDCRHVIAHEVEGTQRQAYGQRVSHISE